ncbi:MAG: 3'-5' exonuclease [Terriglobia bacterium]
MRPKRLNKITGFSPSDRSAPYFFFADPIHQHLLLSGQTCFKGIQLADLKRLQLDIETYCTPGFEFCSPQREEDRIIAIALSDSSGWETVLWGKDLSEAEMLTQLTHLIRERDPDIIEGHNIFKFDLNYIQERAKRHNLMLNWGRDGSEATSYDSRLQIAERTIDYPKWQVHGRHIVDTWILSQYYDIGGRELESLSLKEMAKHFGLARQDRAYVEGPTSAGPLTKILNFFTVMPSTMFGRPEGSRNSCFPVISFRPRSSLTIFRTSSFAATPPRSMPFLCANICVRALSSVPSCREPGFRRGIPIFFMRRCQSRCAL